ncbi:MAG: alpha-amylase family glycosyl hydrolase [Rubrivivax sp.]
MHRETPLLAPARLAACALACALWGSAPALAQTATASATPARGASLAPATALAPVPQRALPRHLKPLPDGWQHGVFMEIFVRAFADSNGDGIGDLKGLTQRLPYLQALGVRGLWLMPITANADGDHGYATTDYRAIAPEYGTLADFDELVREARARGIGIVIDYVINHSAASHPFFREALKGPQNPFRPWFIWADAEPQGWDIWGKQPWYLTSSEPWLFKGEVKDLPRAPAGASGFYFGTFGPHMPDFDFNHPPVLNYHLDSLRFWMNRGLAGYRLDAVPHLVETNARDWNDQPESRRITKLLQDTIKAYPQAYVVCEATAEPQVYGDPAVCGGAFAFGYVHHFVKAAQGDAASVQQLATFYKTARPTMATFVSNHDIFAGRRLWDQVGGDVAQYKLAAAGYLLQPGTPFVYYGEEVGQAGVPGLDGDLPLRSPMAWTADPRTGGFTTGEPFRPVAPNVATQNVAAQQALAPQDPKALLHFYKAVIGLRNEHTSLARGGFNHAFAQGLVLGFQRSLGEEHSLVLLNYGTDTASVAVPGVPAGATLRSLFPADGPARRASDNGRLQVLLAPQSLQVLQWRGAGVPEAHGTAAPAAAPAAPQPTRNKTRPTQPTRRSAG